MNSIAEGVSSAILERRRGARCCWLGAMVLVLACAIGAAAQQPAQQPAPGQKVIQSKAEYDAYMAALNAPDATARAESLAAFVQDYPKSVVLADALEEEMAAWQAAGDAGQVKRVAKRLLEVDSGNIRALGIVVSLDRMSAEKGDLTALNEMCTDASGGVLAVPMWQKPANMSQEDFVALGKLMKEVFIGAEGYCAVQQKNYSQAKDWLTRALEIDSTDVQDNYQLAVADLEMTPADASGFWYCAKAMQLAQSAAIPQDASAMGTYCKGQYAKYHGGDDGWDVIVTAAATEDALPKDFAKKIKPAAGSASPQK
jgi:tetratricopeptide (TPR) repeat protein